MGPSAEREDPPLNNNNNNNNNQSHGYGTEPSDGEVLALEFWGI